MSHLWILILCPALQTVSVSSDFDSESHIQILEPVAGEPFWLWLCCPITWFEQAECGENSSHKGSQWEVTELGSQPGQHRTEAGCHLPTWHPSFPSLFLHPEAPSVDPPVCLKVLKSGACAVVKILSSPFHPCLLGTAVTWGHVCVCSTCPYLLLLADSWSCARLWFISSEKQPDLKIRTHSSKIRAYDNVDLSEFTLTGDWFHSRVLMCEARVVPQERWKTRPVS